MTGGDTLFDGRRAGRQTPPLSLACPGTVTVAGHGARMTTRRQFVAGSMIAGLAVAAPSILRAQGLPGPYPFSLGVTSGDPAPDGFVIWTRLAPQPLEPHGGMLPFPVTVKWEVAADSRFATIAASGEAIAYPELGHSVHVEVTGLQPDRPYFYRFTLGSDRSTFGRARTLPPASASPAHLRFGVCGCQNYEDGLFTAYRHLAKEDLAFVFHYGDFIYEYVHRGPGYDRDGLPKPPSVRQHVGDECMDLGDYRTRYSQYLTDYDLQAARSRHCFLSTFDDHEVQNNWVSDNDGKDAVPSDAFLLRRQAAFQAWYEFMPVRRSLLPRGGVINAYRQLRYGRLAAIDLLDTRSFRTNQPCGDNFKPACPAVTASDARVMSPEEESWLVANLQRRDVAWNGIAQQVMVMDLDRRNTKDAGPDRIYNMDSWAGYQVPRRRLLSRMKGLDNVVVLTGDEHQNYAGILESDGKPVAVEFVSTSISSGGDGSDMRPGSDIILANNPQLKFINDQRGYLLCDVTPDAWASEFMVVDAVSVAGAPIRKRATATVARGEVKLGIA